MLETRGQAGARIGVLTIIATQQLAKLSASVIEGVLREQPRAEQALGDQAIMRALQREARSLQPHLELHQAAESALAGKGRMSLAKVVQSISSFTGDRTVEITKDRVIDDARSYRIDEKDGVHLALKGLRQRLKADSVKLERSASGDVVVEAKKKTAKGQRTALLGVMGEWVVGRAVQNETGNVRAKDVGMLFRLWEPHSQWRQDANGHSTLTVGGRTGNISATIDVTLDQRANVVRATQTIDGKTEALTPETALFRGRKFRRSATRAKALRRLGVRK
jgi:hypothetical protein